MAAKNLFFQPEDFDAIITKDLLIKILTEIIIQIRTNDNVGYELKKNIKELEKLAKNESFKKEDDNLYSLFKIYEQIKKTSMSIRKLLSPYINLNTYDSIGYVFYYNNKRYVAEEIKVEWLLKGSKGELRLNLDAAVKDLEKQYEDEAEAKIRNIFNQHYKSYFNAISGMYKAHGGILGHGKLNRGHIAEAYESHLSGHHSKAYNILNNFNLDSVMGKMVAAQELSNLKEEYWSIHESPNEAWVHVRGALGRQRGTVAGDVGRYQVKSGFSSNIHYTSEVRLSSIANLRRGVEDYCDILNNNLPPKQVAQRLAVYLSERVSQPSKELQAYIANKEFGGDLTKFSTKKTITLHL